MCAALFRTGSGKPRSRCCRKSPGTPQKKPWCLGFSERWVLVERQEQQAIPRPPGDGKLLESASSRSVTGSHCEVARATPCTSVCASCTWSHTTEASQQQQTWSLKKIWEDVGSTALWWKQLGFTHGKLLGHRPQCTLPLSGRSSSTLPLQEHLLGALEYTAESPVLCSTHTSTAVVINASSNTALKHCFACSVSFQLQR